MKVAKQNGCEILGEWLKSMVNHLYWCALSTKDSDEEMVLEKWLSLTNHLHNKHRRHGKKLKKKMLTWTTKKQKMAQTQ